MSRPSVVLIEGTEAWILPSQGPLTAVPLSGDADTDANSLAALRDAILANGATRDLVLVIGGTWLQSARPALPPLPPSDRRRAVHHQSERFFAMRGAIAATVYDAVAVACEASWLRTLREQCASWATIRAVLALPEAVAASGNGAWHGDATPALRGAQPASIQIDVHAGVVADVRIVRGAAPASSRPLDRDTVLRAVQRGAARGWPRERQLLDVATDDALARATRRAWWRAAALVTASVGLLLWATGQHRERQLAAAELAKRSAETEAAGALAAQARLLRAQRESAELERANERVHSSGGPSQVIATLGRLIPPTAFVQHLEWDGRQWKIEGSAVDAAALVPRLDAVPTFEQVRSLAPSTRFLDGGTTRGSFSIGFQIRDAAAVAPGGTSGQQ